MKRTSANIAVFCLASAATAWVWHARFPMADLQPPAPGQPHSSSRRVKSIDTRAWLADLASARSAQAKLDVARQLDRLPANQVRAALEETPLIENGQLTMAARLLLIRWAAQDGEQAIDWAWMRFRSESVWHDAFREIIAAWSWNQPAKLADWAAHVALSQTPNSTYIPLAEAQQSEHPILDTDALRTIVVRLIPRTSPARASPPYCRSDKPPPTKKPPAGTGLAGGFRGDGFAFDQAGVATPSSSSIGSESSRVWTIGSGSSTVNSKSASRWMSKPVPAGMRWPMMTFSLKPVR